MACLFFSVFAHAASFEEISAKRYGAWDAMYYRNINNNKLFCAAETASNNGTILRINFYKDGDAFLEVFNPQWNLREGPTKFQLDFGEYQTVLRGKAWPDAFTHDFVSQDNTLLLLGLFIESKNVAVLNSNFTPMASFSLQGSSKAISALAKCRANFR